MAILITGAAGFIGFHMSLRLLQEGIPVIGLEIGTMSLTGRFVGAQDPDAATDSVFSGLFLASIYAFVISIACLLMTPVMIGIFLAPDTSGETIALAKWGTQLNAFMMFILAWSAILGGALRGVGDTYGASRDSQMA